MSTRKQQHPHSSPSTSSIMTESDDDDPIIKYSKSEKAPSSFLLLLFSSPHFKLARRAAVGFILIFSIWFLLRLPTKTATSSNTPTTKATITTDLVPVIATTTHPRCREGILPFYIYSLPPEFNHGLLADCRNLNIYTDMCPHVANFGMGQPSSFNSNSTTTTSSWFATHQFLAEMIFHARAENHPCRTLDPLTAKLFYVPFYGGLYASSKFGESNLTARDELAVRLARFLVSQPHWLRSQGGDHFLALGRTAWDFMRPPPQAAADSASEDYGFNSLLKLPAVVNMSVLTVERNPWNGANQFGIPYTSYFHPSTTAEMLSWQDHVRSLRRPHLFSFIGGPRKNLPKAAVRDNLIAQCGESAPHCKLVKCSSGAAICHNPMEVLKVMMRSQFCLQAAGDSFTRRSTFDSVLAGCIPVFFSPHTAYTQYEWYLPSDRGSSYYSVFIDEDEVKLKGKSVEAVLRKIPRDKMEEMRRNVIELIPRLTYVHPNSTDDWEEDAVSEALRALSRNYLLAVKGRQLPADV